MATIQIKRRKSSGTGPVVGGGTIKIGEPLIDLNGGSLYIANKDKEGSIRAPITVNDYIRFPNADQVASAINNKITSLELKGASKFDVGYNPGNIPVIGSDGKLLSTIIPQVAITDTFVVSSQNAMLALTTAQNGDICIRTDLSKTFILTNNDPKILANWKELLTPSDKVTSVNGKVGVVKITLDELGGVSQSTFTAHKTDGTHLSPDQKTKLNDLHNIGVFHDGTSTFQINLENLKTNCIPNGIYVYQAIDNSYGNGFNKFYFGINKSAVLTPNSVIDGGTY